MWRSADWQYTDVSEKWTASVFKMEHGRCGWSWNFLEAYTVRQGAVFRKPTIALSVYIWEKDEDHYLLIILTLKLTDTKRSAGQGWNLEHSSAALQQVVSIDPLTSVNWCRSVINSLRFNKFSSTNKTKKLLQRPDCKGQWASQCSGFCLFESYVRSYWAQTYWNCVRKRHALKLLSNVKCGSAFLSHLDIIYCG